ncbi:MAG: LysR family transcriptional regulator [Clostridia bacterium]|nr:LysR family transcriptional regulator [Clostridia bacterium]
MLNPKLYTLLTVAETLNLTQAAAKSGFTQPAVSQHIKALEAELGVKLFIRKDSGIKLTKEGEIAVKYAEKLLAVYDKLKRELGKDTVKKTKINLGIDENSLPKSVANGILNLVNNEQNFDIKLVFDEVVNLYALLENDELDVIITDQKPIKTLNGKLLLSNPVLVLAPTLNNNVTPTIELKNVYETPFIFKNDKSRALFISSLKSAGVNVKKLKIVAESSTPSTAINLAVAGLGYAVLFESDSLLDLKDGKLVPVTIEGINPSASVYAIYKNDFKQNDFISTLSDFIF